MLRMPSAQVAPGSQKGQLAETGLQKRYEVPPTPYTPWPSLDLVQEGGDTPSLNLYPTDSTQLAKASQTSLLFLPTVMFLYSILRLSCQ